MHFLIDENLPAANTLFGSCNGEQQQLSFYSGRSIGAAQLAAAEVLLVRSVTRVDHALLDRAPNLRFVGTATIGTDHVDTFALAERNIGFANAAGCNAIAVGEYVLSAALCVAERTKVDWRSKRALVVGAGNTGMQVAQRLAALGMQVAFIDPPLQAAGVGLAYSDWSHLGSFDLVTCHVPLTKKGDNSTWHLLNEAKITALKPGATLINASRGAVVANQPLLKRLQEQGDLHVVLDVWEEEPKVNVDLVNLVAVATPHIAGHSMEGKIRGSFRLYEALHRHFNWCCAPLQEQAVLPPALLDTQHIYQPLGQTDISRLVHGVYNIIEDDREFRKHGLTVAGFDQLRKEYRLRRELSAQRISGSPAALAQLQQLGFRIT